MPQVQSKPNAGASREIAGSVILVGPFGSLHSRRFPELRLIDRDIRLYVLQLNRITPIQPHEG